MEEPIKTIREARLRKGYSQQKVANLLGMSIGQYQRLENGERQIRNASMKIGLAVCAVLEIDPFMLTFGTEFEEIFVFTKEYKH